MLPQFLQDITSAAPASRDAKSCVSRATKAYSHRHTFTQSYSAKFPRETQNFASLLYLYTLSLANIHTAISRKANSGDARFCVSTLFVHTFIGKHTRCHIAQSSLVRRKILRLYFICTHFHWHTYALPYRAKLTRETQDFASLLYLYILSSANIRAVISRKANSGDAKSCVSTFTIHLNKQNEAATNKPALKHT